MRKYRFASKEKQMWIPALAQAMEKIRANMIVFAKKKGTSFFQPVEHVRLNSQITELTEELEELKSEKTRLIYKIGVGDDEGVKRSKARIEKERENLQKAEKAEARYSVDLDDAAEELHDLEIRAAGLDPDELMEARLALVEQWIFLDLRWSN